MKKEKTKTSWQFLPESSDTLSGVLIGPVCSTSTWISSVSSMFFLLELFLWLLVSRDRGLLLSLLFLRSPGSLRSSRSNVEERTARHTGAVRPPFNLLPCCLLVGACNQRAEQALLRSKDPLMRVIKESDSVHSHFCNPDMLRCHISKYLFALFAVSTSIYGVQRWFHSTHLDQLSCLRSSGLRIMASLGGLLKN